MYILYCKRCHDIQKIVSTPTHCSCKNVVAHEYENEPVFKGEAKIFYIDEEIFIELFTDGTTPDAIKSKKDKIKQERLFCVKVLEYLNTKAGTKFSTQFPSAHTTMILSRKEEGAILEDFYDIIDKKSAQWVGTASQMYLRPKTLFSKTNFQNYIGEYDQSTNNKSSRTLEGFIETVEKAQNSIS